MMNNLEKQHLIKRENLDVTYYFESILQEAYRLKLLNDSKFENIQLQCIQLLTDQTERYTNGGSSSVTVETAQCIQQSIFYTIGVYLKSFQDPDMIISVLEQKSLLELYQNGKDLIGIQLNNSKQLLDSIQNDSFITDNYAYNDSIQNGIPVFFSAYDVDFAAHDTPASIDYPLNHNKMDLVGIEYIYGYLQKLSLENQFCKNFTDYNIQCLLRGFDDHYQDLLINIFEHVLTSAVGCVLVNKDILPLNIEPFDRQYLQQKLMDVSNDEMLNILKDSSIQLCKELNISHGSLQEHISATVMDLSVRIKIALENNCLESIFVSLKESSTQPVIQFEDGQKMNDELFRRVANEIRECRYVSDKIAIIHREIHSITDLVDILEEYSIFDDEFSEIFRSLGDMQLAVLLKKLPTYMTDPNYIFTEDEKEWQKRLNYFFKEIDLVRKEIIIKLAEKINLG